jgi:hypothetical protein
MKSKQDLLSLFVGITGKHCISANKGRTYSEREDRIDSRIVKQYNREM